MVTRRLLASLANRWLDHPTIDYPLAAVAVLVALLIDPHDVISAANHASWYQTLAAGSAVLLSLGVIAITLVFTVTPSDRLTWVYEQVGLGLERLVMSCLGTLVLTTGGFTALFLLEFQSHALRVGVAVGLAAMAALRFGRLWWLMRRILQTLMRKHSERAPAVPQWDAPAVKPSDYATSQRRARRRASG
jgi:hypothetical protein